MITRGSLLIARGRKADNLTFSYPRLLNRAFENMICIAVAFRGLCPRLKYVALAKLGRCRSANSPALPGAMDMRALRVFENMICIAVALLGGWRRVWRKP